MVFWRLKSKSKTVSIVHDFQLVKKQVDIPCDGILGRDFLQHERAKVCYESGTVTLNGEIYKMAGKTKQSELREPNVRKIDQINPLEPELFF